jgi:hypothetical protein
MTILRALCVILPCDEVSSAGVAPLSPWLPPCFVSSLVFNKLVCLMRYLLAAVSSPSFIAGALPPAAQVGARSFSPPPLPPDHSASALHSSSPQGLAVLVLGPISSCGPCQRHFAAHLAAGTLSVQLRPTQRRLRHPLRRRRAAVTTAPPASGLFASADLTLLLRWRFCLRRQVLFNFVSRLLLAPPGPSPPARGHNERHPAGQLLRPSTIFLGPLLVFLGTSALSLQQDRLVPVISGFTPSAASTLSALHTAALLLLLRGCRRRLPGHTAWLPEASGYSLRRFCHRRGLHDVLATLHCRDQHTMASSPTRPASHLGLSSPPWPTSNCGFLYRCGQRLNRLALASSQLCGLLVLRPLRFLQGHLFNAFNINVFQSTFSAVALLRNSTLFNADSPLIPSSSVLSLRIQNLVGGSVAAHV